MHKVELIHANGLKPVTPATPRMRARWIVAPSPDGWRNTAVTEWELIGAGFSDLHPHEESAFILEGELHVEVSGQEFIARPGDYINVPAGAKGRYWAPRYARMLGIYGPNPGGKKSEYYDYWEIDGHVSGCIDELR
ncbi:MULTISPECIES: cupin domain-containing protein [unclassified Burkholderia]|uniref:cupin domain-containing protein n=1 Tax=unclassified Burkholderia TaxID=2613784 RepID=UPI002AAF4495|nr:MULTISPECIES: cupin domain-containing protein [unclassified Burkholderia]